MGIVNDFSTSLDALNVANKPYLFEHAFALLASTGQYYSFKLEATNERGSTMSVTFLNALIAGVPQIETKKVLRVATGNDFI